jgi:signal transduction histidine kinase
LTMSDPLSPQAPGQAQTFASFAHLREILDSLPYVTIILDQRRQIVFFNRALLSLAGPVEENALFGGKFGEAVRCSHALEGEGCGTTVACQTCGAFLAVEEGLKGLPAARECRLVRKVGGTTEWLDVRVTVSPIVAGGERFAACFVRDIGHEKRREALERIFFHDILNSATGVELLARALQGMVAGDASSFAGEIRACATQVVEEIYSQQQLLSAERDELAVNIVSLTTGSVIRQVVEGCRGSALAQDRLLEVAADSHDVAIESDPSILRRVLRNMLLNALEASRPGETVAVGCRDHGGEVEFWVHNPGVMPEPVRPEVFQRSFSTNAAGPGLRTYSIRLLSERYLRGAVTFRSTKPEGTRFFARYPKRLQLRSQASGAAGESAAAVGAEPAAQ